MFVRLLFKSLARRRSRKALAVLAVWIGISLVVGLLALSLDVGDKLNRELRSFGANIKLTPATTAIPVRVGGHELALAVTPAYLEESQLDKLGEIFWSNNLLGTVPRLWVKGRVAGKDISLLGVRFERHGDTWASNSAPEIYRHWQVTGRWPGAADECLVGSDAARELHVGPGETIEIAVADHSRSLRVVGMVNTGGAEDTAIIAPLPTVQPAV